MRIRVLGDLDVVVDGASVDLGGPKPRALVGLLVAAEGRPVPVERLIDQIWGEQPPNRVEASLQSYVARLRRVLEPARATGESARTLLTHAGGYSLDVTSAAVDARRFTAMLREARALDPVDPRRIGLLSDALALWQGTAYSGLGSLALEAESTRLDELRLGALEELWDLRLRRGEHAEAVAELEQLVREHPLREQLWALLVRALYRSARQGDALAALRRAREHLADQLGVDPGLELRRLEAAVLRQDPSLDAEVATPVPEPVAAPRTEERQEVFGRDQALDALHEVLDVAGAGGAVVVLAGEPGIGKTRLADAVLAGAVERGFAVGRGGWDDEACPPLWGWSRAVTQLLGDTTVLDVAGSDATTASYRQGEALLHAVRALGRPALLLLDDVHWADHDSLRLLRRVAAEARHAPLVVLVATRSTDAQVRSVLAETLAGLARFGARRVDLAGLDAPSVKAWVEAQAGVSLAPGMADRLVARTDGNPFYVTELVRLLVAEGSLADPDAPAWRAVPTGVREVVRHRLAQLEPEAAEVARMASAVGRGFEHQVVAAAMSRPLEVVQEAVETLQALGLVEDAGPERSRFSHALVRDAVHHALTGTARARSHAAVAAALEEHHVGRVADHAAELAEHYRLAGPVHARSGWLFAAVAAEQAGARSAHDEALRQWDAAAELQAIDQEATAEERERLLLGRARALIGLARTLECWEPVAAAATSALQRGDTAAAAAALLTVTQDMVWGWRLHPYYDQDAIDLWRRVRDDVATAGGDPVVLARLTAALAFECLFRPGTLEETSRLAEEAVSMVREATNDPAARLPVVQLACSAMLRFELRERRMALTAELVELATRVDHPSALSSALILRAGDNGELGRLEQARSDVVRAHDLAVRHGLTQNLMVTGWARVHLLMLEARWDDADRLLDQLDAFEATLAVIGRAISVGQRAVIRDLQGRLPEMRETLQHLADFHPVFREMYALSLVRSGDAAGARHWLGAYAEQPTLPRDYLWITTTTLRAWVWLALGDRAAVGDLRAQLEVHADRLVYGAGTIVFLGSLHHWVGELAAAEGDTDAARRHLGAALATHEALELPFWTGLTRVALERLD